MKKSFGNVSTNHKTGARTNLFETMAELLNSILQPILKIAGSSIEK